MAGSSPAKGAEESPQNLSISAIYDAIVTPDVTPASNTLTGDAPKNAAGCFNYLRLVGPLRRVAAPSERTRPASVLSALLADGLDSSLPAILNSRRLGGLSGVVFRPAITTFLGTQARFHRR